MNQCRDPFNWTYSERGTRRDNCTTLLCIVGAASTFCIVVAAAAAFAFRLNTHTHTLAHSLTFPVVLTANSESCLPAFYHRSRFESFLFPIPAVSFCLAHALFVPVPLSLLLARAYANGVLSDLLCERTALAPALLLALFLCGSVAWE